MLKNYTTLSSLGTTDNFLSVDEDIPIGFSLKTQKRLLAYYRGVGQAPQFPVDVVLLELIDDRLVDQRVQVLAVSIWELFNWGNEAVSYLLIMTDSASARSATNYRTGETALVLLSIGERLKVAK